jgi:hypothetical protein
MLFQPPPINLGPPPWSEEELKRAVFLNFSAVELTLQNHPGREVIERLESLSSVLRLFNKSAVSILHSIDRFHYEAHKNNLFRRNRRHVREQLEEELQEQLYVFAACSMTLVDQTRTLTDKINVPNYRERITPGFSDNPRHRFVQELRVDMIHITLHEPNWQLTSGGSEEQTTRFLLHPSQLKRVNEYHAMAKQYVSDHPKGIDVGLLVSQYKEEVNSLHEWLRNGVESAAHDILTDYRRSKRIVRAISSKSFWQLILSQMVIQSNRDPYTYLDRFLTPDEMGEVLSLPHQSKIQVDRIVELIDDYGACDIELLELVYRAFNVKH